MSPLMGSHGVALATAMAAVSGTVILFAVCRQRPFSAAGNGSHTSAGRNPRSCMSSVERKRERRGNKKKRVHFAKDAVVEFDRESNSCEEDLDLGTEFVTAHGAAEVRRQMPANRVALYHGILQDRLQRMASSY